jgi:transposase
MTRFREYHSDQMYLLPPSLNEWLPESHLCYFVSDAVGEMDLSAFYRAYHNDLGGQAPYHPLLMTRLLVYAYSVGIVSSRRIEEKTYEDVAFRILAAGEHPDHDTIANFRQSHLKSLAGLFGEVLKLCREAGLVKLGHVSLDGTKVKANASKHHSLSYGRLKVAEEELAAKVAVLLAQAQQVDEEEDARYGKGVRGDELPAALRSHQQRLAKLREAKAALERRARQAAEDQEQLAKEGEAAGGQGRRGRKSQSVVNPPEEGTQYNFTDADSRIMIDHSSKAYIQGYNCQAVVDEQSQIIVAAAVSQQAADQPLLAPMVAEIKKNLGTMPEKLSADAGYYSKKNVELLIENGVDPYIAVNDKRAEVLKGRAARGRIPKGLSITERMRRKLRTVKGQKIFVKRKQIVEPVFGQIKAVRGLRQFALRGREKVSAEWALWCLTHNLLKLFRSKRPPRMALA